MTEADVNPEDVYRELLINMMEQIALGKPSADRIGPVFDRVIDSMYAGTPVPAEWHQAIDVLRFGFVSASRNDIDHVGR